MRWRAWIPRLALVGLVACSSTGSACAWCKDVGLTCGALGYLCVQYEVETHDIDKRRKACGSCTGASACNILEEPPRCTPDPGVEGTACGKYEGDKHDYLCADGFRCDGSKSPARCHALSKLDEPCTQQAHCVAGLGCSWKKHVCIAPHAEGERCHFSDEYVDEEAYEPCAEGLVCNDGERPPVCRKPTAQGEPCRRTIDCEDGLRCVWDAGDPGTCLP